jgi:type I restriction enzyme S subunit
MTWEKVKLGEIVKMVTGKTPPTKNTEYFNGDLLWINPSDFGSKYITESKRTISQKAVNEKKCNLLPVGTILLSCIGDIGKIGILKSNGTSNQQITGLITNERVLPDYLYYYLMFNKSELENLANKAVVAILNNERLRELDVKLPSLSTQKRIAEILDAADALRRIDQELLKKYDELAQAIFIDMFGDPVKNEKGWSVKSLKDISTKIHSGNTPKGGSNVYVEKGITFFRSQNVWKNYLVYDDIAFIDDITHKSMSKSSLKHKDILMTKTGRINTENSSLGRAAIYWGEDDKANVNGHVYLIRLKQNHVHEFVVYIMTSKEYRDLIREVCVGGIDKRQLNKDHIENFPIIYPPVEKQKEFQSELQNIWHQKKICENSLKNSERVFNSLIQKAFKGELVS